MSGVTAAEGKAPARGSKQIAAWRQVPVTVDGADVRFAGLSRDLHTNTWKWACGRCATPAREVIDTMFRVIEVGCERCGAVNYFDFRKYGA